MKRLLFIGVLLPFIMISCSYSTEVTDDSISLSVEGDHVLIKNNERETIFLFLVEHNTAAVINWSPHFSEPNVKGKQVLGVKFSNIYKTNGHAVHSDKVVVYFWKKTGDNPDIKSKVTDI